MAWTWFLCILGAYIVGSVPFGVLLGRCKGIDIREHGSLNIGATNVGRVLGRRWGILCFLLDMSKGSIPVLVAGFLAGLIGRNPMEVDGGDLWLWLLVAIASLCGHMFSIFLRFTGGKGVATAFGGLLAMWPVLTVPSLVGLCTWLLMVASTRIISLSSMVAAIVVPIATVITLYLWFIYAGDDVSNMDLVSNGSAPVVATVAIALLIIRRHRTNIRRLLAGEEPRIKQADR